MMYYLNVTFLDHNSNHEITSNNKLYDYVLKNGLTFFLIYRGKHSITLQIGRASNKKNKSTLSIERLKYYNKTIVRINKKRIYSLFPIEDQKYIRFTITKEIIPVKKDCHLIKNENMPTAQIRF